MRRAVKSGQDRRKDLERTGFPRLFTDAFRRWSASLPTDKRRRATREFADQLKLSDTKSIRNWKQGVSAPASEDSWDAIRAILATAPANAEHLAALDAAFGRARGSDDGAAALPDGATHNPPARPPTSPALVWKAGNETPPIFGLFELRLLALSNDGPSCQVQPVLKLDSIEEAPEGRPLAIAFRTVLLKYDSPGHTPREGTFLGEAGRECDGVCAIPGGLRIEARGEDGVLAGEPLRGEHLFTLDGNGAAARPTCIDAMAVSGGVDIRDATRPPRTMKEGKAKLAVLDAIFREKRDPDGIGRYLLGHAEIWQEEES